MIMLRAIEEDEPVSSCSNLVGSSTPMLDVYRQVERVAQTHSTVLIRGESGTGKELVAEAIHRASDRKNGPFITFNIAAVPENLIESELFGHVKGAFTDACNDRIGKFEAAASGTLFIDEIGDLQLASQAKLLRVLENRKVTPVGANRSQEIDVRVIAATNRSLEDMVTDRRFREDLYYRLNVVCISVPPLRERPDDIPLLVGHFLEASSRSYQRSCPQIDSELADYLHTYHWPGNVRQLRNCMESMIVLADSDTLTMDDLPATVRETHEQPCPVEIPPGMTLCELERTAIEQALSRFRGNRTHAARSLDISVRTLQRRMKKWNISERSTTDNRSHLANSRRLVGVR
jgi:transcriptional regulator with PAS, ATPase and Fis domain